ncbi:MULTISPECIES: DUF5058 family protein [unclassified Nesterenkonia]|uniref:DUF5058 family protein n=1 Tax=unclassified Nesterenkonia TaxID=2629769 RepID=UPI00268C801F|nr:DUF5058 family protein [Nesterenkonia sp. CL21]
MISPMHTVATADISAVAHSPWLWGSALVIFGIIAVQSWIYLRAAKTAGDGVGLSRQDLNRAFRSGAAASVGPSLAVVLVAIALLTLFGTPAVLMRIGLVGSAATETASATIAASTMGADLGGAGWTQDVFVVAFFVMCVSGSAWMLFTLILTPVLSRGSKKLSSISPRAMRIIPGAALLGAFLAIAVTEVPKSSMHVVAMAVSGAAMALMLLIARRWSVGWLKEWALGLAILVALGVVYLTHHGILG